MKRYGEGENEGRQAPGRGGDAEHRNASMCGNNTLLSSYAPCRTEMGTRTQQVWYRPPFYPSALDSEGTAPVAWEASTSFGFQRCLL